MPGAKLSDNFVGAATVGERGQVVIPAEARERTGIKSGDKLLVFIHPAGLGVSFVKLEMMMEAQQDILRLLSEVGGTEADPGQREVGEGDVVA